MIGSYSDHMTKEQLIDIIKGLLENDPNLDFLSKLSKSELERFECLHGTLVRCSIWVNCTQKVHVSVGSFEVDGGRVNSL